MFSSKMDYKNMNQVNYNQYISFRGRWRMRCSRSKIFIEQFSKRTRWIRDWLYAISIEC